MPPAWVGFQGSLSHAKLKKNNGAVDKCSSFQKKRLMYDDGSEFTMVDEEDVILENQLDFYFCSKGRIGSQ